MSDFSTLELFLEVASGQSFSQAAKHAGISQSAVSQRISQFEKTLGVPLLDRSHRPYRLTPAGQAVLEDAPPLVQGFRRLHQRVALCAQANATPTINQPLKLRAIFSAGIHWLGQLAQQHQQQHPDGEPWNLDFASHQTVRQRLLDGSIDLAIVSYPEGLPDAWGQSPRQANQTNQASQPHPPKLGHRPLREEPLALICPPGHRLTREPAVAARHLQPHDLLALDEQLPLGQAIAQYLKQHAPQTKTQAQAASAGFDNLDTLKNAVAATGTPAILPRRCVADELQRNQLAAVNLRPAIARPLAVAYRISPHAKHNAPPPTLADAVAFLQQHAHEHPTQTTTPAVKPPPSLRLNAPHTPTSTSTPNPVAATG